MINPWILGIIFSHLNPHEVAASECKISNLNGHDQIDLQNDLGNSDSLDIYTYIYNS